MISTQMIKRSVALLLMAVVLATGVYLLIAGLHLDKQTLPSALIGKALPEKLLQLSPLILSARPRPDHTKPTTADIVQGRVWLLCVWASWCRTCIDDQPVLEELKKTHAVPVIGLNYKDKPTAARRWLIQYGNPFDHVLDDRDGRAGIELGVYGVPETYVIDQNGIVRAKFVGALTDPVILDRLHKQIEQL